MTGPMHPDVGSLAFLLGTWRGRGEGSYPTIEPFGYLEEARFWHVGKPFVAYTHSTTHPATGQPMHAEAGYLRPVGAAGMELVVAHPSGVAEIAEGSVEGHVLDVSTTTVARTPTAKEVTALRRRVEVRASTLRYEVWMAAVGVDLTSHLRAELHRVAD